MEEETMANAEIAYLGAVATVLLPYFVVNPKERWPLGLVIIAGAAVVIDDVLKNLTDGKYCVLCKIFPPK